MNNDIFEKVLKAPIQGLFYEKINSGVLLKIFICQILHIENVIVSNKEEKENEKYNKKRKNRIPHYCGIADDTGC